MTATADETTAGTYATKAQIAERFQVAVRTIDLWMRSGKLPYYKIGRTVRFSLPDIEAFLNQHSRVSVPPQTADNQVPAESESPIYDTQEPESPRPDLAAYMAD